MNWHIGEGISQHTQRKRTSVELLPNNSKLLSCNELCADRVIEELLEPKSNGENSVFRFRNSAVPGLTVLDHCFPAYQDKIRGSRSGESEFPSNGQSPSIAGVRRTDVEAFQLNPVDTRLM